MTILNPTDVEIRHFHLFCGLGGGALGFNRGRAEVNSLRAKFRCIGGIDVSPAAIRDFNRLSGVRGTVLDMFDRQQYIDFHGSEPPIGWREATPADVQAAAGGERPHIAFLSAPCKGFSGLLSEARSKTGKYQALNRLTLRGMWLMLEAFKDDPIELIIFENVPRIATRGRALLDQIGALLRSYGYAVAETFHDCGEIGGLAQSRKRFLLVARHQEKVRPFLYEPPKRPLRAVGEILEKFPMPGDIRGGPMHALPNLQWKTWVRLAFVEAGSDWRSLNKLKVHDGKLAEYALAPSDWYGDTLGVIPWDKTMGTVTGMAAPTRGAFSVADPRPVDLRSAAMGVIDWKEAAGTIAGESHPSNGAFAVADPRVEGVGDYGSYGVCPWSDPMGTVTGQRSPGQGTFSVADPRLGGENGPRFNNIYRIVRWDEPSQAISGGGGPSAGGLGIADPRFPNSQGEHAGKYSVQPWDGTSSTITGSDRIGSGALCVADPRTGYPDSQHTSVFNVSPWEGPARTITGADHITGGAQCVADPRPGWTDRYGALQVEEWEKPSSTVIAGGKGVQGGWLSVADPRIGLTRSDPYGVVRWNQTGGAVIGSANLDNGRFSVADPRITSLPEASQKLVAIIRSIDGTWHRPFTTLELAALQSLVDPDDIFDLDGDADGVKRERIGNAVPAAAAQAVAAEMGRTLLMAWSGETFMLSSLPIWVQPIAVALSVRPSEVQS